MKRFKFGLGIFLFCAMSLQGAYFALSHGQFWPTEFFGSERNPAAVHKNLDVSNLTGSALYFASQKRLLSDATIVDNRSHGEVGIELGHFITRGQNGRSQFACDFYNRVEMIFRAEGMAVSGSRPMLTITGPCEISEDPKKMKTIWIPINKINADAKKTPGRDFDIEFVEGAPVSFSFKHLDEGWPSEWALESLRLFNTFQNDRVLIIDQKSVNEIMPIPLRFIWM